MKKRLVNIIQSIKKWVKSRPSIKIIWNVYLWIFLILIIVTLATDVYVFDQYGRGWRRNLSEGRDGIVQIDRVLLKQAEEILEKRETAFQELISQE